ncbi:MAG: hypothetical protein QM683_18540 [Lacrimispora sp.]
MFLNKNESVKTVETTHSNYIEKKQEIIRTYEEPVLPKMCRVIFWCMIILTAGMILVDINAFIRYDAYLGSFHLFYNISTTGFFSWLLFSVLLVPMSYGSIRQTSKRFWKRVNNAEKDGTGNQIESNKARSERALKKLTHPFMRYMGICFSGIIFWGVFYFILHFNW